MRIGGRHYRSLWLDDASGLPRIIDQTRLPHRVEIRSIADLAEAAEAIRTMRVRGAPLIGALAAHGLALALAKDPRDEALRHAVAQLRETRPTAVNLAWALDRVVAVVGPLAPGERAARARAEAVAICDEDVRTCEAIGNHGRAMLHTLAASKRSSGPIQVMTHCNAGWLATVDWGTALAPIYKAWDAGLPVHVWVGETRPRNQGASLTAFELREHGVPHTVIVDSAVGHLMQKGLIDVVLVGSDRTTAAGDVCNKIGTYLKALAAAANDVPFYAAVPTSTIDWSIEDGLREIPIEERDEAEVREMTGLDDEGELRTITLFSKETPVRNPAFDVTPARYVTAILTEYGLVAANRRELSRVKERMGGGRFRQIAGQEKHGENSADGLETASPGVPHPGAGPSRVPAPGRSRS
jgi:methylthioribose-1-phosphate isomerase